MKNFFHLLRHDILLQTRSRTEWGALILFFIIIIILLPFILGPEPELLRRFAPGLIWLAALLMSLLSLDQLFIQDARDGTLDLLLLSTSPLPLIVLSKLLAQTGSMILVLLIMLLPAAFLLNMDIAVLPVLALTFVLGVPILVFLAGIVGAITVVLQRAPALLIILLVPLYIPVLIFAVSACDAALLGTATNANLLLLGAILALVMPTAPYIIASALRQG